MKPTSNICQFYICLHFNGLMVPFSFPLDYFITMPQGQWDTNAQIECHSGNGTCTTPTFLLKCPWHYICLLLDHYGCVINNMKMCNWIWIHLIQVCHKGRNFQGLPPIYLCIWVCFQIQETEWIQPVTHTNTCLYSTKTVIYWFIYNIHQQCCDLNRLSFTCANMDDPLV